MILCTTDLDLKNSSYIEIAGPRRHPRQRKSRHRSEKANGLRKIRKRNNKVGEVDTKYTALPAYGTKPLQKCVRTTLTKAALAEWRKEWETETKGDI